MTEDLSNWITPGHLVEMAMYDLGIVTPKEELVDADIKKIMHYIGEWASETDYTNPYHPRIGLMGVGIMLTVTLLEFPDYYERYELSQFN
jgi:hypothetical protein